jgi:hypothetical protein
MMSNPYNEAAIDHALVLAVAEAYKLKLSDLDFDNFVDQRADEILGELPEDDTQDHEEDTCCCGRLLEDCPDAYEHATQGV